MTKYSKRETKNKKKKRLLFYLIFILWMKWKNDSEEEWFLPNRAVVLFERELSGVVALECIVERLRIAHHTVHSLKPPTEN